MTDPDDSIEGEFLPLPFYAWARRPGHLAIDVEEAATALYLAGGLIGRAAERLRVEPLRLVRVIGRSARLTRLHAELSALLNDKVHEEYVRAFASEDDRRREWAASKVANTKAFRGHPLAPNADHQANVLPLGGPARIIISWEDSLVIEHQADEA